MYAHLPHYYVNVLLLVGSALRMSVADPSSLTTLIFQSLWLFFVLFFFIFFFHLWFFILVVLCSSDFVQSLLLRFNFSIPSFAGLIFQSRRLLQLCVLNTFLFRSFDFSIPSSFTALNFLSFLHLQLWFLNPFFFRSFDFLSLLLLQLWFLNPFFFRSFDF